MGGGATFGYQFTPHFGAWTSLDKVLLSQARPRRRCSGPDRLLVLMSAASVDERETFGP